MTLGKIKARMRFAQLKRLKKVIRGFVVAGVVDPDHRGLL
jgi:hypothetical protein